MKKLTAACFGASLAFGCASISSPALAQQSQAQVATGSDQATTQLERIEVTGTFIRRADTETPSPVQVITAQDIRQTGYTTVTDVLNSLTANNQGTLSQGFAGAFASGASGVSLRGLTVAATLVLIDGHRMAPYPLSDDGQRTFVDISAIPLDAIERIEVLKDGASALYGSDAMAGVVNVILKKTFNGASIAAENGFTQLGGGATSHLSGTVGFGDLGEDGQNAYVTVEYRHQDPILMSQRPDLFRQNWTALGGINAQYGASNLPYVPTPASATGYFVNPNAPVTYANFGFLPGCNAMLLANNQCAVPQSQETWQQILPATQNLNILGRFTKRLGENWEANVSASIFQSMDDVVAAFLPPYSTQPNNYYSSAGLGVQAALVNGHGIVNTYSTTFTAPVPANIAAQFGVPTGTQEPINIALMDVGPQESLLKTQTYRLVGELKGTAGAWDIDASYGWSEAQTSQISTGTPNLANLSTDLANGQYVPGIQNSPSVINFVSPAIYSQYTDILWFASVHGTHELLPLPGGSLSIATGADFFFRSLDAMPSLQGLSGVQPTTAGDSFAQGNQSDWSVFGEVDAPVLKSLDFDAALRYDKYDTYSPGDFTPKFGFKWTPVSELALRGTASRGFRAPNPVETGQSGSLGFFSNIPDPVLCPHPANPQTPGNFPGQCNIPGNSLTVGTAGLLPEHSTSYTFGLLLEPVNGHSVSADFYDIKISDQIVSGLAVPSVVASAPIARGAPEQEPFCCNSSGADYNKLTPVGLFAAYLVPYLNLNSTETRGIEYEIKDTFNLGTAGKLKSDIMWSYMIDYLYTSGGTTYNLVGTHGPSEISGDTATPRSRAKWVLTWAQGPVEVAGTLNYVSSYNVTDPSAGPAFATCAASLADSFPTGGAVFPAGNAPAYFCQVASFVDVDLYGGWQVDKNWNLHANIQNLFGREAPLDIQTYASTNFNPSLHMEGAIGRMFNVGFRYAF